MSKANQLKYLISLLLLCFALSGIASAKISFGVQSPRGNAAALKKWSELGNYLSKKLGQPVKIVPLKPNKTVEAVKAGKIDFMLSNPVLSVVLMKENGSKTLATMKSNSGHQFAGVIISKKGSGIKTAKDLVGKKVMAYKFKKSAAAYVFQVKHMQEHGVDPHKDFKVFKEAKKQDDIVLAVKNGVFDAGFVKTGLLEAMQKEGKISLDDFIIVDQMNDGFSLVHTTKLYPSWTVTASPSVDDSVLQKVKKALLDIKAEDAPAKKANIVSFVEAASMDSLDETLKELKLPPYK